ncbi:tRNA CCA-pyrophosphorylase, partial [Candidatus Haloredivivus sp. G17]
KGEIKGHEVEIVPCYDTDPENIQSAVDRTPHHTRWAKNNLDSQQRKDVVALKVFLDAQGLYGSSLEIQGFSGYLCEILIAYYGSFEKLIEKASQWQKEERIAELLPESPQAVLLHLDNRLDNLLIDDNQVTAFLDWSHPEAGHHEYDIVRAEYLLIDYDLGFLDEERKKDLREALYEAYEGEMKIEKEDFEKRKNLYRKITVIWIMTGFPNWGAEFEPDKKKSFRKKLVERARKEGL